MRSFKIKKCEPTHELVKDEFYYDEVNKTFRTNRGIIALEDILFIEYEVKKTCGEIVIFYLFQEKENHPYIWKIFDIIKFNDYHHDDLKSFLFNTLKIHDSDYGHAYIRELNKERQRDQKVLKELAKKNKFISEKKPCPLWVWILCAFLILWPLLLS